MPQNPNVIDAAGRARSVVSPEDMQLLEESGSKFVAPEEGKQLYQQERNTEDAKRVWGTGGQAAWGLANGATLGLGPGLASKFANLLEPGVGDELSRHLQGMEGSGAYQAGDIAGMVLPALLTGGESVAGRGAIASVFGASPAGLLGEVGGAAERLAGRFLPEASSAMGKIGNTALKLAARGASEGALMNMTGTIGHNLVYNHPLTAESLAASGVDGALFGGVLGGALGGFGKGLGLAGESIVGKTTGMALKGSAKEGLTVGQAMAAKQLGADATDIARMKSYEGGVTKYLKDMREAAMGEETFASHPDAINRTSKESQKSWRTAQESIAKTLDKEAPNFVPQLGRVQERLQLEVARPFQGTLEQDRVQSLVNKLQEEIANTGSTRNDVWQNWVKSRNQLGERIQDFIEKRFDPSVAREFGKTIQANALNVVDSEIRASMEAAGDAIGKKGIAEQYASALASESFSKHMADMTSRKAGHMAMEGNSILKPHEVIMGGGVAALGHPLSGAALVSGKGIARIMERRVTPRLAEMAYQNAINGKVTGSLFELQNRTKEAVKNFFNGTKKAVQYEHGKIRNTEDFQKAVDRTADLLGPFHQQNVQNYASELSQVQPELANQMLELNKRGTDYLNFNMQQMGIGSKKLKAAGSMMKVPKSQGLSTKEWKYIKIDQSVKNGPHALLNSLENGTLTTDEVRATKYVYPEFHKELVASAADQILEMKNAGKYMDANKVSLLSIALDTPLDRMMEPDFIASVQSSFAPAPDPNAPAQAPAQPAAPPLMIDAYNTPLQNSQPAIG